MTMKQIPHFSDEIGRGYFEKKTGTETLDNLPHSARARVVAVRGSGAVARRLMEMGIVPGAPISVVRAAPLGDPLEVRVRNYHLALRRSEAQTIEVALSDM
jgi:Fe2+ transport system protein FeoA